VPATVPATVPTVPQTVVAIVDTSVSDSLRWGNVGEWPKKGLQDNAFCTPTGLRIRTVDTQTTQTGNRRPVEQQP
jgi:hypothetical protein